MQKTGKAGKAKTKDMSATERMHREGAHGLEGSFCRWSLPPLQLRTPASGRRRRVTPLCVEEECPLRQARSN